MIEYTKLIAYLNGELSEKEKKSIEQQIKNSPQLIKEVNDLRFILEVCDHLQEPDSFHINRHWENIQTILLERKRKKRKQLYLYISQVAAILLLFFSIGISYYYHEQKNNEILKIAKIIKPNNIHENVQLILANQKEMIIDQDLSKISYNNQGDLSINSKKGSSKLDTIVYNKAQQGKEKIQFNQLIVPAGKRSYLTLSDGSKIWVNANTRVIYPVVFNKNNREIYVDGEIFIEVTPNKKRPFLVKTNKMNIKVLGTSFNVSSFDNEKEASVVLVKGKVNVNTLDKIELNLSPNELLSYKYGKIKKQVVEDVTKYISWKEGFLQFDHEQFSTILDKLSKYYHITIHYTKNAGELYCSGTLNLQDNIFTQLNGLEKTVPIQIKKEKECIKIDVKPLK